ncbi:MAG: hypothetical protein KZQ95_01885 [Candidatus Thiodiazotropha sp. (ex Epidulcina cf. delphinae)]|nr:hypothetical protein [Candidatus Thiodiazotropha sp. (ex Epidulcina cf. delphinae)]
MHLELTFKGGLLERYPEFCDVLRAAAYGCGRPFKHIAADLDMTASKLSRMLADNPNDPINFPADRVPDFIESTNDTRPALWLAEKFLVDSETVQRQAVAQLAAILPQVEALLRAVDR